jgi:hypothetical protein
MTEPITVRKTLSRLVYAVEQMSNGKSKSEILSDIGFTEEELDFIINYDIKYRMGKELEGEDEE